MSDTMMQEILKRLDLLEQQLGVGAQYAWATLMRQEFWVNGIMMLLVCLVGVAMAATAIKAVAWMRVNGQKADSGSRSDLGDLWHAASIIIGMLTVVVGLKVIFTIPGAIAHIINPSYYALMDLAKMLTGK